MYTFDGRIRYSECDSEGRLTLTSLLNYFQDCSTFQSEDLGVGVTFLKERHLVWVLASWHIVMYQTPYLLDEVEIGTFPYAFKGFLGSRNFFMKSKKGGYLAKADSLWTLIHTDTGKPTRIPEDVLLAYHTEQKLLMDYQPRKILVPEGGILKETIEIKKHHLDTNKHVNNGQYIDMATAFLPEQFIPDSLRAEYKKQAWLDDILYPYVYEGESKYWISLRDTKGVPYCNVEFSRGVQTAE
jgi:acyl-ACP thioesterase